VDPLALPDRFRSPPVLISLALALLAGGTVATNRSGDATAPGSGSSRDAAAGRVNSTGTPQGAPDRLRNAYDGGLGFIVPYRPDCPLEAERQGGEPPKAFKEWCARVGRDEGIKHGWYSEWYPSGRPSNAGAHEDGLRVGVWTRWYPSGGKRVQAEFQRGLQHGKLISWDEDGNQLGEQLFENGSMVGGRR
jgi:hypothetical protein